MTKGQLTGLAGTHLVAAQLALRGFNPVVTSRNMKGTDILVENVDDGRTSSIQVKTNRRTFSFWLVGESSKRNVQPRNRFYVLVNIRTTEVEYYVVPARVVRAKTIREVRRRSTWYSVDRAKVAEYKDRWSLLGRPEVR